MRAADQDLRLQSETELDRQKPRVALTDIHCRYRSRAELADAAIQNDRGCSEPLIQWANSKRTRQMRATEGDIKSWVGGASDANLIASVGVPTIDMGAHGGRAYSLEEYIDLDSFEPKNTLREVVSIFGK